MVVSDVNGNTVSVRDTVKRYDDVDVGVVVSIFKTTRGVRLVVEHGRGLSIYQPGQIVLKTRGQYEI